MQKKTLAIIGMGPRGLFALEQMVEQLQQQLDHVQIWLFETGSAWGCGPVYAPSQPATNWINIAERTLELPERPATSCMVEVPAFPSFLAWAEQWDQKETKADEQPDIYPPRAKIGRYLQARFYSLVLPLVQRQAVRLFQAEVCGLEWQPDHLRLSVGGQQHYRVDEALLTVGHQRTELDEQLERWQSATSLPTHLGVQPYPVSAFRAWDFEGNAPTGLGLRGFGLAMLDVVRAVGEWSGRFGQVVHGHMVYVRNKNQGLTIFPFSLDGLPLSAKPLNAALDKTYAPSPRILEALHEEVAHGASLETVGNLDFLIQPMAKIAAEIYVQHPQRWAEDQLSETAVAALLGEWLEHDHFEHPLILAQSRAAALALADFMGMAKGERWITLDYCMGQVWRHCQLTLFRALSFTKCPQGIFNQALALHERMKRYAYGPPVLGVAQMLAMISEGILNLKYVENPQVEVVTQGWKMQKGGSEVSLKYMVNTVLDSPNIAKVATPLIKNLRSDERVTKVAGALGFQVNENGMLTNSGTDEPLKVSVLGRLAKGTIIGVDSLVDCFGPRTTTWAKACAERLSKR
ncbi:FAD/NAD(P)-binding protein [Persicobacter psychrovividus]|uniref:FAD-dependent urate hydroxylase HpyO/Asp monooxygenase CreE-like FAD/NAD(P)-binding domain-containing protein n=1 Tax=Persicobacter psychrovividus TaxID=387638 RepID=A0ABN6LD27_9BACT|nr:hypothetical protein PEPS_33600 [Persicobacter psychrovividus]